MAKKRQGSAILELLLAAALWGFGFVATVWCLKVFSVLELTFLRFLLASLIGLPFVLVSLKNHSLRRKFRMSFVPALWLMGTLILQTWGLVYTTPTKSAFITTLYVVFVPLLEAFLARRKIPLTIWGCVLIALIGTALIVDLGFSDLNIGDVMTFISALFATGQIYWMGSVSGKIAKPFVFNIYQCFWSVLFVLPLLYGSDLPHKLLLIGEWPSLAFVGLLSLAIGSTVIAFYLQVRAQQQLSRTVSSLMFLLESPFAMIFAMIFLGQSLHPLEALGALLISAAAFFATWLEARLQRNIDFAT